MRDKKLAEKSALEDIIYRCDRISRAVTRFGGRFSDFEADADFQDVISMNLQQIGEDSTRLSDALKSRTADRIPWPSIRGMRNLFAYEYNTMDEKTIWKAAINDVFPLKEVCLQELEKLLSDRDEISLQEPSREDK